jgi:DNA repair photolyase
VTTPGSEPEELGVRYVETAARTITRRYAITDPWFVARYGCNLYRGCEHGCAYCDGRAERYHVAGVFDRDIQVKTNALELLDSELERRPEPGFLFLGGGVCDAWQPADARYRLARGTLELALKHGTPVHALTKSAGIERDLDLLERIGERNRAILAFSINTVDDALRARFEPAAAPVEERYRLLEEGKRRGLVTGLMAMPVLPGLSDQPEAIDALVARAAEVGVDFVMYGGLTLRPGGQKEHMLAVLQEHHPGIVEGYRRLFAHALPSGVPDPRYLHRVEQRFAEAVRRHRLPSRVPHAVFAGLVPRYTELALLLEHREQADRLAGLKPPPLGRAGMTIQGWARKQLGQRARCKGFSWLVLEREFIELLEEGRLGEIEGMPTAAVPIAEEIADGLAPVGEGAGQMTLV